MPKFELRLLFTAIEQEQQAQFRKFGERNHTNGTGDAWAAATVMYRNICQNNADRGQVSWADILLEEVFEALAESDTDKLTTELIQVMAVCATWIEAMARAKANKIIEELKIFNFSIGDWRTEHDSQWEIWVYTLKSGHHGGAVVKEKDFQGNSYLALGHWGQQLGEFGGLPPYVCTEQAKALVEKSAREILSSGLKDGEGWAVELLQKLSVCSEQTDLDLFADIETTAKAVDAVGTAAPVSTEEKNMTVHGKKYVSKLNGQRLLGLTWEEQKGVQDPSQFLKDNFFVFAHIDSAGAPIPGIHALVRKDLFADEYIELAEQSNTYPESWKGRFKMT